MPSDIIVGLAISVIIIGFLILAGVAFWLALERRRSLSGSPSQPTQQRPGQPAAQQFPPAFQGQQAAPQPAAPQPAAAPVATATPAPAESKASGTAPAGTSAQKDATSSGEYPSAALYDQTMLPERPKRRTRPRSQ